MHIIEITTKTALAKSKIPGISFAINPYLGCGHGCRYCYAVFMRKYSHGHEHARWGDFVEVKANIAGVLRKELAGKRRTDTAMLSSVCDPYQPVEAKYKLTRECILALREFGWGIDILTRSPLVLRDCGLLASSLDVCVGMSLPTDDDEVRKITEPHAPPIEARIATLKKLHEAGLRTWAFIAPMLPMNPVRLHELVSPHVDFIRIDALNYREQVDSFFRQKGIAEALTDEYAVETAHRLETLFGAKTEAD
jgi:DNA repair photolyase